MEETGLSIKISNRSLKIKIRHTWYFPITLQKEYLKKQIDTNEIADVRWFSIKDFNSINKNRELVTIYKLLYRVKHLAKLNKVVVLN